MLRSILYKTLGLALLVLIMISNTGISTYTHECRSEKKSVFALYPEILGSPSSCCAYRMAAGSCGLEDSSPETSIKEPDCCMSSYKFSRLASFYKSNVRTGFKPLDLNPVILQFPVVEQDKSAITSLFQQYLGLSESPPLYGKKLLYFLHIVKIPEPLC